ncbi:E3 ubiquitin-protein ligase MBR2-like [Corylus avellana]|uniref:E3 ubiquitin-protein ligase MBR2-like n=1 Tax=Corylus avellana TaxID=13451 RepID=UPI00286B6E28|nr:E3 ubiquitin-protein ligase MBR2-like [Corylus avellana]
MQGQRITFDCFSEVVDIRQGSVSNSTGMSQQTSLNNALHPVESPLSNYMVSSGETTSLNASTHDVPSFSGWNTGEPSSRLNPQSQVNDDGMKIEHGLSSSFIMHSGSSPRLEEGQIEATNILFPGRSNIGLGGNRVRSGPLFMQGSSSNHIPQNVNLNAGYVGNSVNSGQGIGSGLEPNANKSSAVELEQISSSSASSDNIGTSSGSSSYMEDGTGGSGSSLGTWGLSCKRKALEGTSGQSYPGGTSSSSSQAENVGWHTGPARHEPSYGLFTPSQNSPNVSPAEQQNLSIGIGIRGEASDAFPSLGVTGNAEIPFRNFDRRASSGRQQEAAALNLSSRIRTAPQSARSIPFSDSLDLRPTLVSASSSGPQSHSHARHIPGFSGGVHPFHWNGASNSRVGSVSSSLNSGERNPALREGLNIRSVSRNNAEHPMFVPASDVRNSANDPTSWSLATGNIGNSGGVPSTSRVGSSSSIHTLPNPTWLPRQNPPAQNQQRLSESPWSLFSSVDSEYGGRSGHFTSLPPGPSTSSQDTAMSSGPNSQGHHQQYPRSAFFMERQSDDVLGIPHSLRALAVDIEGRRRLISEIRQVLSAMRRGENLRVEDYMPFEPFIYHGMADMHDRHRDMRLDVDNMSYEELLALEERIGDVSTGLSEDTITKLMKQQKYFDIGAESPPDLEPCCICQEEYVDGDDLGALDCGHDFHTNCIKQWLMQKNLCPICKTTALPT